MSKTAVIQTGGKQYRVVTGDVIKIEKIGPAYSEGDDIVFDKIVMLDDGETSNIGTPFIESAKVEGKIEAIGKAKKIDVVHYRSKSRHFKRQGHRQPFFAVRIGEIK